MDTEWFKKRMRERKVSQGTLSKELGRERTSIVRILSGKQPMRIDEAAVFARLLGTTYLEVIEHALAGQRDNGIDFEVATIGVPLRYRIAAAEADAGLFEFPEPKPRVPTPPRWIETLNAFAAEVVDQSIDMRYPVGSVLYCVPPNELGRPILAGDICVVLHLTGGKPFEVRAGIVTPAPGSGFIVVGASRDPKLSLSLWFERESSGKSGLNDGTGIHEWNAQPAFNYTPSPSDAAIIAGVVTGSFQPEA